MALVAVPILLIVMWFAMAGTVRGSNAWSQALVGWLAGAIRHIPFIGGLGAAQIVKLQRWIANKLGDAALAIESHTSGFFAGALEVVKFTTYWLFAWPLELLLTVKWLAYTEVPRLVHALREAPGVTVRRVTRTIGLTKQQLSAIKSLAASVARAAVHVPPGALTLPDLGAIKWLRSHYRGLVRAAAVAGGLAIPWAEVPRLRHALGDLLKRIRAQEKRLAALSAAGVIAAVLAKLGAGWLRCQKVRKYGPRVCHMDTDWLDALFLDAAVIFGTVSVVTFAKELRAVEDEALAVMAKIVREFPEP